MSEIINAQNLNEKYNTVNKEPERRYSSLACELRKHEGVVVGVLSDPVYDGMEVPSDLRFEHIAEVWGNIPGVRVVPLDAGQIRSYSILFKGKMDILVYPYGSVFPMDAMHLYSAQTFNHFLKRGGAVLTTGGIPFMKQAGPDGSVLCTDSPDKMTEVYDKWVSKFGVKYYECPIPPVCNLVNTDLLPSLPALLNTAPCKYGIAVNNSTHEPVPKPPHGNVFPERYPARRVIPLLTGVDRYGTDISTTALLVQDFENGSRRIHFTHEGDNHPLSPSSIHFVPLLKDLFRLLTNRTVAVEVSSQYACYRQGETVCINGEIMGYEQVEREFTLQLQICERDRVVCKREHKIKICNGSHNVQWEWKPERFETDEYIIRMKVQYEGKTLSEVENGFIVWDEGKIQNKPILGTRKEFFTLDGKGSFITGTNYYESTRGEIMWFRPNTANIIRDFRQMNECGVNMIRPHYHHLKWFKDYLSYSHGCLFPFFKELEHLNDPMPDERGWRIWDLFIYLSHKYNIIYNGDLFTLVPEEMGDPRGWFGTVETVYNLEKRKIQKQFLKMLEDRYRNLPLISWDLFNEPYTIADSDVVDWADDLHTVFEDMGSKRLLTVGGPFEMKGKLDYDCPHGRISEEFINTRNHPVLLQELHIDKDEPLDSEIMQAEELRRIFVSSLRSGVAGICPWSWTRQMRLWQDSYEHHHTFPMEKWDDRLGLHSHDDGTIKIAGQVFKDISLFLRGMDITGYNPEEMSCTTLRGKLLMELQSLSHQDGNCIYHVNEKQCMAAMAWEKVEWADKCLLCGPSGHYVYFFSEHECFSNTSEMFVKTEGNGVLTLMRGGTVMVELVYFTPDGIRVLHEVPWVESNGSTILQVDPEMSRYWLRVRYPVLNPCSEPV